MGQYQPLILANQYIGQALEKTGQKGQLEEKRKGVGRHKKMRKNEKKRLEKEKSGEGKR